MNLRDAMRFDGDRAALYLERGWWPPADTLSRWFVRAASETPDATAIAGDGQSLSYRELAGRVAALAGGLKTLGLGSGDVVAVQLPNRAEYLVSYLAICAIGGVMTTLYVPCRAAEMETLPAHSGARAFIGLHDMGDFELAQTALDLRCRVPSLEHVIVLGEPLAGACSFTDLTTAAPHDLSDGPVAADPFLLLYTSGTSARPKGVPLAYQDILGNARLGVPEHGIEASDRILSAAPFGHLYALYSVHLALAAGASTALLPAFTPPVLARTLAAEVVTVLFAAPAHIASCLGTGLLNADALSASRLAVLSGSAVAPAIAEGLQERMPAGHVTQLWGMTETQTGLHTRPGDSIGTVAGSAGRPGRGAEVRGSVRTMRCCRPARKESCTSAARCSSPGTSTIRRPTATRSPATAGSAPATSPWSAPAETSRSRDDARTSSTAAESSTTPVTSRTCSPRIRRSTWRRSYRSRTRCRASVPAAASPSPAPLRRPWRPSARTWKRTALRRFDGRSGWRSSMRCR